MKKLITFIAAGVFALSMAMTSFAGSWQRNNVGWWYQNDNGTWPAACWQQINGAWYYFNPAGYMLENTTTPDGYYVGADGSYDPNAPENKNGGGVSSAAGTPAGEAMAAIAKKLSVSFLPSPFRYVSLYVYSSSGALSISTRSAS